MTLVSSCSGLYFPTKPMDNVVTLSWKLDGNGPHAPRGVVIFKVKSSDPNLFYVMPRYGALLATDASGNLHRLCTARTFFGLRPPSHKGNSSSSNGSPSAGLCATPLSTGLPSALPTASRTHKERFAIDYRLLSADVSTYEHVEQALTSGSLVSESVRNLWEEASNGKFQILSSASVHLKVFRERVESESFCANSRDSEHGIAPEQFVVPSDASLVPPFMHRGLGNRGRGQVLASKTGILPRAVSKIESRIGESGLVSLKSSIDTLRSGALPCMSEPGPMTQGETLPSASTIVAPAAGECSASVAAGEGGAEQNIVMCSASVCSAALQSRGRKGIPLFVLIGFMILTHVLAVLLLRRGGHKGEGGNF
ncbi:hypothetical protein ERJ75_000416700 [Trypanosoma vivax]|uniref:Uncharacterized protein n=1 Tax=Trypanosoma vivax (strain Y486) TaxID=1055687 RepID=G0TZI3_TRYVY|nr:hypothetical protein ERJ75_000416700 [Trypanosoma vivax]CCC49388.1 conserved hypothetical protein [Trypanosoma vivax Y486]